ncbi:MAG TPA: DUF1810 domain-containing protein [Candidatus Sulfotelmatobacter sp.]|jgi:uncharacterized protein (DUF1810 family)
MSNADPFHLQRFVDAQDSVFEDVLAELKAGAKVSHWMWFVFPQIRGLGSSEMSQQYAISSREEAKAYLQHPVLGPRLRECTRLVLAIEGKAVTAIFGPIDAMKFRSSMTLFADASAGGQLFTEALRKYFQSEPDAVTLRLL